MSKTTKHTLLYIIVGALLLVALSFLFMATRTSQTKLSADIPTGALGVMPVSGKPQFLTLTPELRFKLDTGADVSTITEEDLQTLEKNGYKVEKLFYPAMGRDGRGDINFSTVRYRVDLPFFTYSVVKKDGHTIRDSVGEPIIDMLHPVRKNVIHNVDFMPSKTGFSVLGIDFLEKFKLESIGRNRMAAFYFDMPKGYEEVAKIYESREPMQWAYLGHRYYVDIDIDGQTDPYFIDSGIQKAFIKRPSDDIVREGKTNLDADTVASYRGKFPAMRDDNAWIKIGNREGKRIVYFYDNDEEVYAINPLNMFDYDLLLDFAGGKMMFKR